MAKELTVAEKLKQIYELQLVDSELGGNRNPKRRITNGSERFEDEIAGLNTRVNRLKKDIDGVNYDIGKHEANIKESESLIERYNRQMDNVKNNREYDALSKELELQKLEIQLSERKSENSKKR